MCDNEHVGDQKVKIKRKASEKFKNTAAHAEPTNFIVNLKALDILSCCGKIIVGRAQIFYGCVTTSMLMRTESHNRK